MPATMADVWKLLDGAPGWVALLVIGIVWMRQWRSGLRSDPTDTTGHLYRKIGALEERVRRLEHPGE